MLRTYRLLLLLLAGWFLLAQSLSVSHATTYGDGPHQHDDVVCAVSVASHESVAPLPVPVSPDYVTLPFKDTFIETLRSVRLPSAQSRAPPPRAPPFQQ